MNTQLPASERAFALLLELSTQEKMAQLNCYLPQKGHPDGVTRDCPGGVGHISCLEMRSMETLEEAGSLSAKNSGKCYGAVRASYSCHISYGRSVRRLSSGCRQLSVRHWPGVLMGSALEEKGASPADLRLKGAFALKEAVLWRGRSGHFMQRPVFLQGLLYNFTKGIAEIVRSVKIKVYDD